MTDTITIPVWAAAVAVLILLAVYVGLAHWFGAVAAEQDAREVELDARTDMLSKVEGEQAARTIRRSWDVALPGISGKDST